MPTTDDLAPQNPRDDGPLTNEQFRAIVGAARKQHGDATLHKHLRTDPVAAKQVSAGRKSVRNAKLRAWVYTACPAHTRRGFMRPRRGLRCV